MGEVIGADIFQYLNLPFMGTAGSTDSKLVDAHMEKRDKTWQLCICKVLSLCCSLLNFVCA